MTDKLGIRRTNTVLYCENWHATVKFYRDVLSLPVEFENDWLVEMRITANSFVSIADSQKTTINSVNGQGITLSLQVADLSHAKERLITKGVTTGPTITRFGSKLFYFHDPEGHRIEFWEVKKAV